MKRELWLTACITTFCLSNAQSDEGYPTQGGYYDNPSAMGQQAPAYNEPVYGAQGYGTQTPQYAAPAYRGDNRNNNRQFNMNPMNMMTGAPNPMNNMFNSNRREDRYPEPYYPAQQPNYNQGYGYGYGGAPAYQAPPAYGYGAQPGSGYAPYGNSPSYYNAPPQGGYPQQYNDYATTQPYREQQPVYRAPAYNPPTYDTAPQQQYAPSYDYGTSGSSQTYPQYPSYAPPQPPQSDYTPPGEYSYRPMQPAATGEMTPPPIEMPQPMAPVVSQSAPIEPPTAPTPAPAFQEPLAPLSYPEPAPMAQAQETAAVPTAPVVKEEQKTATLANGQPAVFRPMEETATDATNGSVDVPAAPQQQ
ncbi:MAG: hypothetical protein JMN27_09120 [gamma proteobacterium endosymbiont of Lamellibrachia anaximandri]|nr:hypothetical protein [gamma proteobacterium endosymbiont of Lamellibrachia anaximandri]MBL3533980.1 hypothetical protein [gamma proteobacterium endosymbiont of Lamellibrachia anaximandri]